MTAVATRAGLGLPAHALEAMLARDVSPAEVDDAIASPDYTRPDTSSGGAEPRTIHVRGEIAVVTAVRGGVRLVVTVLYHRAPADGWDTRRPSGRRLSRNTRRRLVADLARARRAAS